MRPILFLFPVLLCAASPPHLSLEALVAQSETIFEGQGVRAWAAMDSENRFIWTHYEIKVSSTIKGPAEPSVVVGEPRGPLNAVSLLLPGLTPYTNVAKATVF